MFVPRKAVLTAFTATLLITQVCAQSQKPLTNVHQIPTHVYIDNQAVLAKQGSEQAIRNLTDQLFTSAGMPKEITSALGFNERVVQAELKYRNGMHPAASADDIVKAVNNLANTIGAPAWSHTDAQEVTKMRMWLLVLYPHMIASSTPRQPDGKLELLSPKMSPVEATYIATSSLSRSSGTAATNSNLRSAPLPRRFKNSLPSAARNYGLQSGAEPKATACATCSIPRTGSSPICASIQFPRPLKSLPRRCANA